MTSVHALLAFSTFAIGQQFVFPAGYKLEPQCQADRDLIEYFQRETQKLQDGCLSDVRTIEDWNSEREQYRKQLF